MKILIYTAIFGGYDLLKPQPSFSNVDYVCFTDSELKAAQVGAWTIARVKGDKEHPRLAAKRFKLLPHQFVRGADITIWIDGSIVIVDPHFVQTCIASLQTYGIACMKHPGGNCIYQEAAGCLHMEKYTGLPIPEQVAFYRSQGYPENNGLAACGIIVRDMRIPQVHKIGEDWWEENQRWSYQDQISFPYVLWKNNYWFDTLKIDYFDRSKFVLVDHLRPEE